MSMSITKTVYRNKFEGTIESYRPVEKMTYTSRYQGIEFYPKEDICGRAIFDTFSISFKDKTGGQSLGYGIKITKEIYGLILKRIEETIGNVLGTEVTIKRNKAGEIVEFGRDGKWFRLRDFHQYDCGLKGPVLSWTDVIPNRDMYRLEELEKMCEKAGWGILDKEA